MAKTKGMTEGQLAALVRSEIDDSIGYDESDISVRRAKALDYYEGKVPDVPAEEGRSQATSHDVADVIGWVLPGLMRTFLGSDRVVVYEPEREGDEPFAQQATDYINYVFMRECDGYRVLYDACFEGLLFGNGVIKHWWDTKPKYETLDYTGLSDEAYTLLVKDDYVTVLQHTPYQEVTEDGQQITTHDVKIRCVKTKGRLAIKALPPEEFLVERYAQTIADARFLAHRRLSTRGELIAEGFKEKDVMDIGTGGELRNTDTKLARWDKLTSGHQRRDSDDPLMQEVEVFECYVQADYDGDGHVEWRKVVMAGSGGERSILANDEWGDEVPFSDLVPEPRPHRWDGRSVYDEVQDIMRIKTALTRQTLDNLYLTNHPQKVANPTNVKNPDELMSPSLGGTVWADDPNGIVTLSVPFVAANSFQMLEYLDMMLEKRTGVSKQSSVLDGNELQNQSATAAQLAFDASHAKQELYARNIAEIGLKRLFKCLLKLIVKHQDEPRTIRLRDQWVQMDPRVWNTNMDATVNVGLGTGSRDRDIQALTVISNEQKQIIAQMGPTNPIVKPSQYVATLHKMVEAAGLKSPELYFAEVTPEIEQAMAEAAANQPNPEVQKEQIKAQSQAQLEQAKTQSQMQLEQAKMQMDREQKATEAQAAALREQAQMEADLITKQKDRESQLILEQQRQQFEREKLAEAARQKELDRRQQWELEMAKLGAQREQHQDQMSSSARSEAMKYASEEVKAGADKPVSRKKGLVRGKDGRATHVESDTGEKWTIVRGPDGRASHIEAMN